MKDINSNPELLKAIDFLLTQNPGGLREIELINLLDKQFHELFPKPDLTQNQLLFQHHFILRHHIYRLQDQLIQTEWSLFVNAVKISKHVQTQVGNRIIEHDPVRDFYLDYQNLFKTTEDDIQNLLDDFWVQLKKFQHHPAAHQTLGLTGNESFEEKKKRAKQLLQKHHPDKGGDPDIFSSIQNAWQQIKK